MKKAFTTEFWQQVGQKPCYEVFRKELLTLWEQDCTVPITELSYSDFVRYARSGDRAIYEAQYFRRRRAISAACLLALIYPQQEQYLARLVDELFAIANEYTWCLPAHQGDLQRHHDHVIDLFAAETAFALAEIDALLGDRLPPLLRARIRHEADRRVLCPYKTQEQTYWWETCTNNWAAVCNASVAGAVMYLHPEWVGELEPRFAKGMDCFLSGFSRDGMCLEGVSYWRYGFGFFTVYADMIRTFTQGRVDYFAREEVQQIATFIQAMFLSGEACVSFADGSQSLRYQLGLAHRLKREYPHRVLAYDPALSCNYDWCGRFCLHLRSAVWLEEEFYHHPDSMGDSAVLYAPHAQWFIKKTPTYGFAAKGGHNEEHHNHNDVGNFIFAKNGKQLIMDLGAGPYTRQYFSDERYTLLHPSSRSHSVPIINGALQQAGECFAAKDVTCRGEEFSLEMAGAYGCEGLQSLRRRFVCQPNRVTLTDEICYEGEGQITQRLVSAVAPTVEQGKLQLAEATVYFDPALPLPTVTPIGEGVSGYFIDFTLPGDTRVFTLTLQ